ncbi:MAG: tripartite tricarboxylate transporter TctB family protein [Pseudomonadota bacterium]
MRDNGDPADRDSLVSTRTMDIAVAVILMVVGALVINDSLRLGGPQWSEFVGPGAGYFPFFIGALITAASAITLLQAILARKSGASGFVKRAGFGKVLLVLVPTAVYVGLVAVIGIYIASMVFIAAFMVYFGRYRWVTTLGVSVGVAIVLFLMFEVWFLVPLPKGPVEDWLGY